LKANQGAASGVSTKIKQGTLSPSAVAKGMERFTNLPKTLLYQERISGEGTRLKLWVMANNINDLE